MSRAAVQTCSHRPRRCELPRTSAKMCCGSTLLQAQKAGISQGLLPLCCFCKGGDLACEPDRLSQHFIILYYTMLYYIILYCALYYTISYYTILYYTVLYYIILYYTILSSIILSASAEAKPLSNLPHLAALRLASRAWDMRWTRHQDLRQCVCLGLFQLQVSRTRVLK